MDLENRAAGHHLSPTTRFDDRLAEQLVCRVRLSGSDRALPVRVERPVHSAGQPLAHVENRGIILNLAKTLIGCMAQTAVVGPAPEVDLGD
jgi:hypothetical protein